MMALWNQGEAIVSIDNTTGTLTDVSADVLEVSFDLTRDSAQNGTLGNAYKAAFVGKKMASGTITVFRDTTTTSAYHYLKARLTDATYDGEDVSLQIDEPDAANGSLRIAMEIKVTSMGRPSSANSGDGAQATFNFISNGAITESIIST